MTVTINGTTGLAGVDGSAGTPAVQGGDTNTGIFFPAADTVGVATGGSERMRIDSSGNVGIGTSSPAYKLDVNATSFIAASVSTSYSGAGNIRIADASTTSGSAPYIGSVGNNLTFGRIGTAEYMRIDSSGNVTIANGTIQTTATADTSVGFNLIKVSATVTAGTNKYIQFLTNNGAASTGFIASNGANNAGFFAGSDRRIKTDIQAVSDGVQKVMQLKPSKFKFKENNEQSHGFIAQELNEVFPECVYKPNDGEGSELQEGQEPWAINLDKLIPYLTAAIQEQQALITALTDRITALEAK